MGLTPVLDLTNVTAAVLAGGLGTRLRSVLADRPKVLAQVHGRPFLTYLLDQLAETKCRSVVLCTGYLGEQIWNAFGETYKSLRLSYSQESEPLGTGGALKFALPRIVSDPVLVMNGDSYCEIDLTVFRRWHHYFGSVGSIALSRALRSECYGRIEMDEKSRILSFSEKQECAGPGWINAGIYMLGRELLTSIPEGKNVSLEHDVFPGWLGRGLYGYYMPAGFFDIGTPEDFSRADEFFSRETRAQERPTVVLDRDGTIIKEREYLSDPAGVELIPGTAAALLTLQQTGFDLVIITNQSGIARQLFSEANLQEVHQRLEHLLAEAGVRLAGIYVCPHRPEDDCGCRKPRLGLMEQAAKELGFNPEHSFVIGDKASDIEMGRAAGAVTFLVRTGYGAGLEARYGRMADYVVDDLAAAVHVMRQWRPKESAA